MDYWKVKKPMEDDSNCWDVMIKDSDETDAKAIRIECLDESKAEKLAEGLNRLLEDCTNDRLNELDTVVEPY